VDYLLNGIVDARSTRSYGIVLQFRRPRPYEMWCWPPLHGVRPVGHATLRPVAAALRLEAPIDAPVGGKLISRVPESGPQSGQIGRTERRSR